MNFKLKDIVLQLITVTAVVLIFGFFTYNAQINMENRGIDFGYGFYHKSPLLMYNFH